MLIISGSRQQTGADAIALLQDLPVLAICLPCLHLERGISGTSLNIPSLHHRAPVECFSIILALPMVGPHACQLPARAERPSSALMQLMLDAPRLPDEMEATANVLAACVNMLPFRHVKQARKAKESSATSAGQALCMMM